MLSKFNFQQRCWSGQSLWRRSLHCQLLSNGFSSDQIVINTLKGSENKCLVNHIQKDWVHIARNFCSLIQIIKANLKHNTPSSSSLPFLFNQSNILTCCCIFGNWSTNNSTNTWTYWDCETTLDFSSKYSDRIPWIKKAATSPFIHFKAKDCVF